MNLFLVLLGSLDLGAIYDSEESVIHFRIFSAHAQRVEVYLFAVPSGEPEKIHAPLSKDSESSIWSITFPIAELEKSGISSPIYYGYRAWGPNWTWDETWKPGGQNGFAADVDKEGHRFDPNKLLLDPYAREVSHDPLTPRHADPKVYASGPKYRTLDSAPFAPKAILLEPKDGKRPIRLNRPFKDEILYEVHVRGFTMNDPGIPKDLRGTYRGAALKAPYLKELGITAVEFLPVHEFQNEANDVQADTEKDNYWGYMTLNYFSPERRYAFDKSPGGPTREFQEMVHSFHEHGIKVYLDVVYNHTGEEGLWDKTGAVASLISWRGLDNRTYYELTTDGRGYWDNTGCGGNVNVTHPIVRDLIMDSLWYWVHEMGVDGFRFDLAPILANSCPKNGFQFVAGDTQNILQAAPRELGVDLIAEPWGIGEGTFQLGNFPSGWAEWNAFFRDTIRKAQNKWGTERLTPDDLATRLAGSPDLFRDDGRKPWHSLNYVVCHDGFTLRDLYSYNAKKNQQPWPYGPSDGGDDNNHSWDQGGDSALQRQAARTGLALLMLSAGVPMITGGDEFYRTQHGNNNPYNVDSSKNWLDWNDRPRHGVFFNTVKAMIAFRRAHAALRPSTFFRGTDDNGNHRKDIAWLRADGTEANEAYLRDSTQSFLAYLIDGTELKDEAAALYMGYNWGTRPVTVCIPPLPDGNKWYWAGDTSESWERQGNFESPGQEELLEKTKYLLAPRSLFVLIQR